MITTAKMCIRDRVQVEVGLAPGVLQLPGVQRAAERPIRRESGAGQADGSALGGGAVAAEVVMGRAVVLVVERGEAPSLQVPVGQVGVLQQPAGGVFRMQAFVAGVEHRGLHHQFAVAQLRVAQAELQGGAGAGIVGRGAAVAVTWQQAGAGMASATVELEAKETMCVDAYTDRAFGETGANLADETLGPFLAVVLAAAGRRAEVAVQKIVAAEQRPAGVFCLTERGAEGEGGEQGAAWSVSGADHGGSGVDDPGLCGKRRTGSCKGVLV